MNDMIKYTVVVHVKEASGIRSLFGGAVDLADSVRETLIRHMSRDTFSIESAYALLSNYDVTDIEFYKWLHAGIGAGYCDTPVCDTHDVYEMSDREHHQYQEGNDICINVTRLRGPFDTSMDYHS